MRYTEDNKHAGCTNPSSLEFHAQNNKTTSAPPGGIRVTMNQRPVCAEARTKGTLKVRKADQREKIKGDEQVVLFLRDAFGYIYTYTSGRPRRSSVKSGYKHTSEGRMKGSLSECGCINC
jgi:hypothetical protein